MNNDTDEAAFLAAMPARPKLLPVPKWQGGSDMPTRERYDDDFEKALLNFHKYRAVQEHNARLVKDHEAAVAAHIHNWARRRLVVLRS